jgi:hypothetical protein
MPPPQKMCQPGSQSWLQAAASADTVHTPHIAAAGPKLPCMPSCLHQGSFDHPHCGTTLAWNTSTQHPQQHCNSQPGTDGAVQLNIGAVSGR